TQDPIPSSSAWAYNYAPYSYDPAKAKQLLEFDPRQDETRGLRLRSFRPARMIGGSDVEP
ncbi:MAG: hypothetical protein P8188_18290, partial [Gemmatimonadota bacterium]